jgi:hypothetical protein
LKVGDVLQQLFPEGTKGEPGDIRSAPELPTDIFGAAAYLLERSGAYHLVFPMFPPGESGRRAPEFEKVREFNDLGREWFEATVALSKGKKIAALKAKINGIRLKVEEVWNSLCDQLDLDLIEPYTGEPTDDEGTRPSWWLDCACLLVFADEASREVGYRSARNPERSIIDRFFDSTQVKHAYKALDCRNKALTHLYADYEKQTFAPYLNRDLARVLPKGRTPSVGCTVRALSHNLALISHPAPLELAWFVQDRLPPPQFEAMNLLLVPFPFEISSRCFRGQPCDTPGAERPWGWFHIEQLWLKDFDIVKLVRPLLEKAEDDSGPVHAIILPELALNWAQYAALVEFIIGTWNPGREDSNAIQFIVAGTSQNYSGDSGNFAYVTSFHQHESRRHWEATSFGRRKHHRWKLTRDQLRTYAIGSVLDPNMDWWENTQIERRALAVHVFRESASVAALICEDLARSDPCHEPLRALGPNLVVALLMDGAQLPERWAGRYATGLADDPGSSVLTLSSLGLIERSNRTGRYTPSRVIALWKDDSGVTVPLNLPEGAGGISLTLSTSRAEEFTLDGRQNSDAVALRYLCHQPVYK